MAISSLGKMMSGSRRSTGNSGRGSSMNFIRRIDPGRMLGRSLLSAKDRFVSNIGSGDMGYRAVSKGYRIARGLARNFDMSKRKKESSADSLPDGSPVQFATSLENFKNFKIVVFRKLDTIIDLLGKLQLSKPIAPNLLPPAESPVEEAAPEKDKSSSFGVGFLLGLLSGLAMKYLIAPLTMILKKIIGMITRLWNALKRLFMNVVNKIKSIFRSLWRMITKVKNLFLKLVKFVKNLIPKIANALKEVGKSIGKFFKNAFTAAKDYIIKKLGSVKNFIVKMATKALESLGKMLLKIVPAGSAALKALLKSSPAAAKAVAAAAAAKKAGAVQIGKTAAELLANGKGTGMKLLRYFAKLPGINLIAQSVNTVIEIAKADEELERGDLDKEKHNKKVGEIIISNLGALIGGTIGLAIGSSLAGIIAKAATAGGAVAGAFFAGVGAVPGALIGGAAGAGAGILTMIGVSMLGAYAGEKLLKEVFKYFGGDFEKLGEFFNNIEPPEQARARIFKEALEDFNEYANNRLAVLDPARRDPSGAAGMRENYVKELGVLAKRMSEAANDLYRHKHINQEQRDNLVAEINRIKKRATESAAKPAAKPATPAPPPAPAAKPAATPAPDYKHSDFGDHKALHTALHVNKLLQTNKIKQKASGKPTAADYTLKDAQNKAKSTNLQRLPSASSSSSDRDYKYSDFESSIQPAPPVPPTDQSTSTNVVINTNNAVIQNNNVLPVVPASRGNPPPSPFAEYP